MSTTFLELLPAVDAVVGWPAAPATRALLLTCGLDELYTADDDLIREYSYASVAISEMNFCVASARIRFTLKSSQSSPFFVR